MPKMIGGTLRPPKINNDIAQERIFGNKPVHQSGGAGLQHAPPEKQALNVKMVVGGRLHTIAR